MTSGRFGTDRHKPQGKWIQACPALDVAGIVHRLPNVRAFCDAVRHSERKSLLYGVTIVPEPDNQHDRNVIMVFGFAWVKPWFRKPREWRWHIGYIPAEDAKYLTTEILSQGAPLSAELHHIYVGRNGFTDISIIPLTASGFGPGTVERRNRRPK